MQQGFFSPFELPLLFRLVLRSWNEIARSRRRHFVTRRTLTRLNTAAFSSHFCHFLPFLLHHGVNCLLTVNAANPPTLLALFRQPVQPKPCMFTTEPWHQGCAVFLFNLYFTRNIPLR